MPEQCGSHADAVAERYELDLGGPAGVTARILFVLCEEAGALLVRTRDDISSRAEN
jgi:hypothetical protein